jgi:hypothetical protein
MIVEQGTSQSRNGIRMDSGVLATRHNDGSDSSHIGVWVSGTLNRIEAFVDPGNIGSRKLLEKVGLREEGYLKECFFEKNRFVDALLFAVLKKEYDAQIRTTAGDLRQPLL